MKQFSTLEEEVEYRKQLQNEKDNKIREFFRNNKYYIVYDDDKQIVGFVDLKYLVFKLNKKDYYLEKKDTI